MITCDMCGTYDAKIQGFSLELHEAAGHKRQLYTLDLCSSCEDSLATRLCECIRNCRVSHVRDAISSLTPEQVSQVEAYIGQLAITERRLS